MEFVEVLSKVGLRRRTFHMLEPADVMNRLFSSPLNPPKPPPLCFGDAREGTVGAVVCPRKALMAPTECYAKRSVEPHPLTTIDPALRFKGTSLRNTQQRSWDVHRGSSHAGEGLVVFVESGSSGSGRRRSLRLEV